VRQAIGLVALGAAVAACAHTQDTVEPYRSDRAAAAALEARANFICAQGPNGPRRLPEKSFVTDGCSLWFDDGWAEPCCVEHDIRYWCGGEPAERSAADATLRACVDSTAAGFTAEMMWLGVRVGGHPIFPTWYRWGYGRSYLPWYDDYASPPPEPPPSPSLPPGPAPSR
jgi:hypothetical protein